MGVRPDMKSKLLRFLIVAAAITGLVGSIAVIVFLKAGQWLVLSNPVPPRADLIFTCAGENARLTYARELLERFPSAHWVLSDENHIYQHLLARDRFDMSRVSLLDSCSDTFLEIKGLAGWLSRGAVLPDSLHHAFSNRQLTIVFVSSPYHMRRIKFMAENIFGKEKHRFYYCPVPLDWYHLTREDLRFWWRSKILRRDVMSELGKLLVFWFFK